MSWDRKTVRVSSARLQACVHDGLRSRIAQTADCQDPPGPEGVEEIGNVSVEEVEQLNVVLDHLIAESEVKADHHFLSVDLFDSTVDLQALGA